jgi:hypothetical protein
MAFRVYVPPDRNNCPGGSMRNVSRRVPKNSIPNIGFDFQDPYATGRVCSISGRSRMIRLWRAAKSWWLSGDSLLLEKNSSVFGDFRLVQSTRRRRMQRVVRPEAGEDHQVFDQTHQSSETSDWFKVPGGGEELIRVLRLTNGSTGLRFLERLIGLRPDP